MSGIMVSGLRFEDAVLSRIIKFKKASELLGKEIIPGIVVEIKKRAGIV